MAMPLRVSRLCLFLRLIARACVHDYPDLRVGFPREAEDGEGSFPTVEVDGEHVYAAGLVFGDQLLVRRVCSRSFPIIRQLAHFLLAGRGVRTRCGPTRGALVRYSTATYSRPQAALGDSWITMTRKKDRKVHENGPKGLGLCALRRREWWIGLVVLAHASRGAGGTVPQRGRATRPWRGSSRRPSPPRRPCSRLRLCC